MGEAAPMSALVVDANRSITGVNAISCTALTVGGVAVGTLPSFLDGISPGTAANNKALVLNGSGSIATIASLTATNIYGSIKTAAQPNITSVGTLSGLTLSSSNSATNSSLMTDYALSLVNPNSTNDTQVGLVFGVSGISHLSTREELPSCIDDLIPTRLVVFDSIYGVLQRL